MKGLKGGIRRQLHHADLWPRLKGTTNQQVVGYTEQQQSS